MASLSLVLTCCDSTREGNSQGDGLGGCGQLHCPHPQGLLQGPAHSLHLADQSLHVGREEGNLTNAAGQPGGGALAWGHRRGDTDGSCRGFEEGGEPGGEIRTASRGGDCGVKMAAVFRMK